MSSYQSASVAIMAMGFMLMMLTAPMLRLTARNYAFGHGQENQLVKWISRVLGLIVVALGLVTYLQWTAV